MATFTVPDRRTGTDPNEVIDPSLAKDSTAGLQKYLDSTPPGSTVLLPFALQVNGTVYVTNGRTLQGGKLYAPNAYPWRVVPDLRKTVDGKTNAAYNPDGICAPWLYDLTHSPKNPYGKSGTAGEFGGYDGTTGASGVDYDGKHLSTRLTAPFTQAHVGKGIRVMAYGGFSQFIDTVSADGKTVTWVDKDGTALHEDSTHTCGWAINAKLGWCVQFMPNPTFKPRYVTDKNWHNYEEARRLACVANRGRSVVVVRDTARLNGVEVEGSNPMWGQSIISLDQSWPMVTEFQHGIYLDSPQSSAYLCESHHHFGDGMGGPGQALACRVVASGRHGMVAHFDDKLIDGCVIDLSHRASIDIELSSGNAARRVMVRNTAIGNHGISFSTPLIDSTFDGVHSTDADVDAGRITSATMLMRGPAHGGKGSRNVSYLNCAFDVPSRYFLTAQDIDGLHVHGCKADVYDGSYFVRPYFKDRARACKNVDVSGNTGGPKMAGQVAPIT